MKLAKFFSAVFAALGLVLMAGTVSLCISNLNTEAQMAQTPAGAISCTEQLMANLAAGDYASAQVHLYGSSMDASQEPESAAGQQVWDAFVNSFTYEFDGDCYGSDTGICRDVTITTLDVAAINEALGPKAEALLAAKIAEADKAADQTLIYDENWKVHDQILDEVMGTALTQVLAEVHQTITHKVTLQLICQDGKWLVVPDDALLSAVSGGI